MERRNFADRGPGGHGGGHGGRGPKRPHAQGPEPRLDLERAAAEARRFAELAVREMGLELEFEITQPASEGAGGAAGATEGPMVGLPVVEGEEAPEGNAAGDADGNVAGERDVLVSFRGADEAFLLERNGELLLALEHVAHRWLRLDPRLHDRVRFDCGEFRATQLAELKLSARVAAQRVRETGQAFRFNPMSSRERRIIHLELTGAPGVRTMSEGSGDRRQLVIYPAEKHESRRR